jgi:3D (Asp-Asp-Asp) domain-containing protein
MTRFILSSLLVLVLLAGMDAARADQNSKRQPSRAVALAQAAVTKTETVAASTASTAANAVAALGKAARMSAQAMDEEMEQAARKVEKVAGGKALGNGLARLTAYWCGEDHYTRAHISATGVRLHSGHCAVDPSVIPFGSVVQIQGIGTFLAVDTGTAVVSRKAARWNATRWSSTSSSSIAAMARGSPPMGRSSPPSHGGRPRPSRATCPARRPSSPATTTCAASRFSKALPSARGQARDF